LSSEFSQRNESFALTRIFKTKQKQKQNKNDLAKERRNAYYRTTAVLY